MSADVVAVGVTHYEHGGRTIEFVCTCGLTHLAVWPVGKLEINAEPDCGAELTVKIPQWAFGVRSYAAPPYRPHVICSTGLNDNAIDEPALNWEE